MMVLVLEIMLSTNFSEDGRVEQLKQYFDSLE